MHTRMSAAARTQDHRLPVALDPVRDAAPIANPSSKEENPGYPGRMTSNIQPLTPVAASTDGQASTVSTGGIDRRAESIPTSFFDVSVPRSMPMPLRGSYQVLVHQNIVADVEGLSRIQDEAQLRSMVRSGSLVALPASSGLAIDPRLSFNRRYSRPWTAKFLSDLTRAHERFFGDPLILTSAVRTVSFQRHLAHYNGNAAPAYGDTASPHLTGQAIDIGKKGMSLHEIAWMRAVLGQLQASGKLDVEEEFQQACFHISVYKTYLPHSNMPMRLVASNNPSPADAGTPDGNATTGTAIAEPAHTVAIAIKVPRTRRHSRGYEAHHVRRAIVHHRRRHRRSMSLLAAGLR